jgi:hypothetical protein
MTELFLIVKRGCEGIEDLLYATTNIDDTIEKLNEFKLPIIIANDKLKILGFDRDEFYFDEYSTAIIDLYKNGLITEAEKELAGENENDYCIMKWDGVKFYCICKDFKNKI